MASLRHLRPSPRARSRGIYRDGQRVARDVAWVDALTIYTVQFVCSRHRPGENDILDDGTTWYRCMNRLLQSLLHYVSCLINNRLSHVTVTFGVSLTRGSTIDHQSDSEQFIYNIVIEVSYPLRHIANQIIWTSHHSGYRTFCTIVNLLQTDLALSTFVQSHTLNGAVQNSTSNTQLYILYDIVDRDFCYTMN